MNTILNQNLANIWNRPQFERDGELHRPIRGRPTPPPTPTLPTLDEVTAFVKHHLKSVENRQLETYMLGYDTHVDWYGVGYVSANHIRQQMKDLLQKWDKIVYGVTGPIQVKNLSNPPRVRATYPIGLDLSNFQTHSKQTHTETVEIEIVDGALKIVSEHW